MTEEKGEANELQEDATNILPGEVRVAMFGMKFQDELQNKQIMRFEGPLDHHGLADRVHDMVSRQFPDGATVEYFNKVTVEQLPVDQHHTILALFPGKHNFRLYMQVILTFLVVPFTFVFMIFGTFYSRSPSHATDSTVDNPSGETTQDLCALGFYGSGFTMLTFTISYWMKSPFQLPKIQFPQA